VALQNSRKIGYFLKFLLIFSFIAIEALYFVLLWKISDHKIDYAYLIKDGTKYVALFRVDNSYESKKYDTLFEAVSSLNEEGLTLHRGQLVNFEIEYLSLGEFRGYFELKWKLFNINFFNRLTFKNKNEALFFEQALKKGAYSPSPFGHSLLFIPAKKFLN